MSATGFAIVLSLFAGLAGSIQVAVNGALGERIGVLEATAFNLFLSGIILACALVVIGRGFGGVIGGVRQPPWLWIGGIMGVIVVTTITFSAPRIGSFATIGLLIAGQLVMGAVVDRFGLFGVVPIALSWQRVSGIVLLAAGAALALHRG